MVARKEILATMLLYEEIQSPLPASYFQLFEKKRKEGVVIKRLGFGKKQDCDTLKERIGTVKENYSFRYYTHTDKYQRLILIDRKILFFGVAKHFFQSTYKPMIELFLQYFLKYFKKGKL